MALAEDRLVVTVEGQPDEIFRRIVPAWVSICHIDHGILWMIWGLN